MGMKGRRESKKRQESGRRGRAWAGVSGRARSGILKSRAYSKGDLVSFFIENWILIAVAFSAGAMLVWPAVSGWREGWDRSTRCRPCSS